MHVDILRCIKATQAPDIMRLRGSLAAKEKGVIRFRLAELLAEKSFREGRRVEWQEVAEGAGVHRTTLSRMLNLRGYNASTSNLDGLCRYFGCQVGDLAEYVADDTLGTPAAPKSYRGPKPAAGRPDASPAAPAETPRK